MEKFGSYPQSNYTCNVNNDKRKIKTMKKEEILKELIKKAERDILHWSKELVKEAKKDEVDELTIKVQRRLLRESVVLLEQLKK